MSGWRSSTDFARCPRRDGSRRPRIETVDPTPERSRRALQMSNLARLTGRSPKEVTSDRAKRVAKARATYVALDGLGVSADSCLIFFSRPFTVYRYRHSSQLRELQGQGTPVAAPPRADPVAFCRLSFIEHVVSKPPRSGTVLAPLRRPAHQSGTTTASMRVRFFRLRANSVGAARQRVLSAPWMTELDTRA